MTTDAATGGAYPLANPALLLSVVRAYVRYVPALFFVIVLFSCDIDFYIVDVQLYGLGLVLNVAWFCLNLILAPVRFETLARAALWPLAAVIAAMLLWSVIFQFNTGGNFIFSFLALRHWLMFLLAPNIYLAHRIGVSVQRMVTAFLIALICAWIVFLGVYMFAPLEQYANSPDPAISRLVARDWRGLRLMVFPYAPLIFSLCYVLGVLLRRPFRVGWLEGALAVTTLILFAISFSRFISLAVILGTVAYVIARSFLPYMKRYSVLAILTPGVMLFMGLLFLVATFLSLDSVTDDRSYLIRLSTFLTVVRGVLSRPILGLGQASNYSISQQQLFGPTFNAEDTGIIGLVFLHGLVGLFFFMMIAVSSMRLSVQAYVASRSGPIKRFMGAMLHYSLVLLFLAVFSPLAIGRYGVPLIGCLFGFARILLEADVPGPAGTPQLGADAAGQGRKQA